MNSRKWNPKRPATPIASVVGGTRHSRTRHSPGSAPIASAVPVSRNGGRCASDAPSAASVPHSAMAPSAARIGRARPPWTLTSSDGSRDGAPAITLARRRSPSYAWSPSPTQATPARPPCTHTPCDGSRVGRSGDRNRASSIPRLRLGPLADAATPARPPCTHTPCDWVACRPLPGDLAIGALRRIPRLRLGPLADAATPVERVKGIEPSS